MDRESGSNADYAIHRTMPMASKTRSNKRRLRVRLYASLLILDCVGIVLAFVASNLAREDPAFAPAGVGGAAVLLPLFVTIAVSDRDIYGIEFLRRWRHSARRAISALLASSATMVFVAFCLKASAGASLQTLSIGVPLSLVWLSALRFVLHRLAMRMTRGEPLTELLIWDHDGRFEEMPPAALNAATLDLTLDVDNPRALDRLGRLLDRVDRVVISCPVERRATWAMMLKGANIQGELLAPELETVGALNSGSFNGTPTLVVSIGPLDTRSRALKRALDLVLATGATLVLLPLLGLVALAIRIDDGGPLFFVQTRLGRGNRLFSMYKFRSMRTEQCDSDGNQSTAREDKRVTRVGKLIRATSMDELPQLLNVLKGDMSLVGPRPHALGSLAGEKLFWEVDQRYWHRHAAKPGITGLAQVRGFRGATHLQSDLADRLQADLDYVNGWTLWRDVSILLATFKVVLHRNAY